VDTSLVIPAHNERGNIPLLLERCWEVLEGVEGDHEVVIIDDGSADGSAELLDELAAQEPRLRVIHHAVGANIGCHPSEMVGFRAAEADAAVFLPADLQILPDVVPDFLKALERADVVASHRVHRADRLGRRLLSKANNRIERLLIGVDVHDAHSSMALNRRALDALLPKAKSNSALIPAELLINARQLGLCIAEIEIPHYPRHAGRQTGAKPSEVLKVQLDLLRLRTRLGRRGRAASKLAAADPG
jgi:glycosyltransferase involved in cell wall biosynthesis